MNWKRTWLKGIHTGLFTIITALLLLLSLMTAGKSDAAGLLIADGGFGGVLEIKEHNVKVTINNGVAVTRVTQIFRNTENRQVEALYTFPVPKGASVANFSMWIKGKEMVGEVLEKKRARQIYDSYKQKRRDPGLLEHVDYRTFEMRIFPINAGAEQKVQITYYQELNIDHDRGTYVYPLATVTRKNIDSRTTGKFAINVEVKSAIPIVEIGSPSHGDAFVIANYSDTYSMASLETSGGSLGSDVVISYDLSRPKTGLDMLTSRRDEEDGYFYLTLTAGEELAKLDGGMDYIFLLDISGSMGNDSKLVVSRNSLNAFIDELGDEDQFEVMTFNVEPNTLFGRLQPGTTEMKDQAKAFMATQQARGGTILAPAMTTAYKYGNPDRTLNVVVLSDGMTEQKERRTLMQLIESRPRFARVFCIGIGNEVNRPLLEQMAEDSGGLAAFVSRGDNFKRQAQSFRRKLMRPVATDLQLDFNGIRVYDTEPENLPNLYHGSPIRVYGRYTGSGQAEVSLKANVQGIELNQSVTLTFPKLDSANPEIERMWAWKRVDQLQKSADRTGSRNAVIDEIIRLGEAYSIVTEYTSFLVLENDGEYQRWKIDRRNALRLDRDRQAQEQRRKQLEALRNMAVADIGPQPAGVRKIKAQAAAPQKSAPQKLASAPQPTPQEPKNQRRQSSDFDFNLGSGPVGPFFIGIAYWLRRRKLKK
jgi:Ca-activated chloride channel family protein